MAAPLLSASTDQISLVVPFEVAGPTTKIQVIYQGNAVASTTASVQAASPAIFAVNGSGGGTGSILNQDGSVNSSTNPAAQGSVVSFYATGGGLTTPASQDGLLASPPYPALELPVSVTIAGLPATVTYAGWSSGEVEGEMQIDVIVPSSAEIAPFDQILLTVGNYTSPSAVTIAVQQ
jgi:uncharacterized protein (TIGR03437 family)